MRIMHVMLQDTQIKLSARGMSVGCLHGELDKAQRQNVLARFKRGEHRALIVSDVAARGLDVPDCDAVINLELPSGPDHYAHRAGRTGRAGRCDAFHTFSIAGLSPVTYYL